LTGAPVETRAGSAALKRQHVTFALSLDVRRDANQSRAVSIDDKGSIANDKHITTSG